jgi:galactokinase
MTGALSSLSRSCLSVYLRSAAVDAAREFEERFGRPAVYLAAAPGRVNLIGEHTDYNGGYVLPMTIDRWVVIAAAPVATPGTRVLRVHSTLVGESVEIEVDGETGRRGPQWSSYVRGVVAGFRRLLVAQGGAIPAVDALIASNVPAGGGLASSAALEVATAHLIELLTGLELSPLDRALLCQRAEHDYAGVPCGLMDQLVCAQGEDAGLLLIDCGTQTARPISMGDEAVTILIANTNVRHSLGDGAYAQRRAGWATWNPQRRFWGPSFTGARATSCRRTRGP